MKDADDSAKLFHILIGKPDEENCPICRAHAKAPEGESLPDPEAGEILIQELSVSEILRCPCPLCQETRQAAPEGAPPRQAGD